MGAIPVQTPALIVQPVPGMVAHAFNASTWEVEAELSGSIQGQIQLYGKFMAT